jgi:hypothetical protein
MRKIQKNLGAFDGPAPRPSKTILLPYSKSTTILEAHHAYKYIATQIRSIIQGQNQKTRMAKATFAGSW